MLCIFYRSDSLKYFVGAVKGVLFKNLYKLQLYCYLVVLPTEAFAWKDQIWAVESHSNTEPNLSINQ